MIQLEARRMPSEEGWSRCRHRGGEVWGRRIAVYGVVSSYWQWHVYMSHLCHPEYETCDCSHVYRRAKKNVLGKYFTLFLQLCVRLYLIFLVYFVTRGSGFSSSIVMIYIVCTIVLRWHTSCPRVVGPSFLEIFRLHLIQVTAHSTHTAWRQQKAIPWVICTLEPFLLQINSQYTTNTNIPSC